MTRDTARRGEWTSVMILFYASQILPLLVLDRNASHSRPNGKTGENACGTIRERDARARRGNCLDTRESLTRFCSEGVLPRGNASLRMSKELARNIWTLNGESAVHAHNRSRPPARRCTCTSTTSTRSPFPAGRAEHTEHGTRSLSSEVPPPEDSCRRQRGTREGNRRSRDGKDGITSAVGQARRV